MENFGLLTTDTLQKYIKRDKDSLMQELAKQCAEAFEIDETELSNYFETPEAMSIGKSIPLDKQPNFEVSDNLVEYVNYHYAAQFEKLGINDPEERKVLSILVGRISNILQGMDKKISFGAILDAIAVKWVALKGEA